MSFQIKLPCSICLTNDNIFFSDITQFSKQLSLLKAVLKSFNALLINYNEELNKIRQEVNSLNETSPTCSGVINIPANETDAVIFNSILISNM